MIAFLKKALFGIQQRLNRNAKQLTVLQKKSHLSLKEIIQKIDAEISSKIPHSSGLTTKYEQLGGANNFGFLRHALMPETNCSWVTKFALSEMLTRERFLLQWHQKQVLPQMQFAPKWLTSGVLGDSNISFMVTECLTSVKSPSFQQVTELYSRSQQGGEVFQNPEAVPVLEPGSRIRDILVNLVCQFDSPKAKTFLDHYFLERKKQLPLFQAQMDWIEEALSKIRLNIGTVEKESLGFVHGDFKPSNMMLSRKGNLKLIDFQYWCYGIRVWDLAFFLSKQKKGFEQTVLVLITLLELSEQEKKLLIFHYVIAVLLHPKSKQFKWQFTHQILPALKD
ncbi:MAG: phosphotransferase [Thiomicrorhabdus sp.]|nr:phosphotransferase [Thiomicrorhabdus sp.]